MCTYSMVVGHQQGIWPTHTFPQINPQDYANWLELVEKARKYDEMMAQKDCPDPKKEEWAGELAKFMKEKYGLEPKP